MKRFHRLLLKLTSGRFIGSLCALLVSMPLSSCATEAASSSIGNPPIGQPAIATAGQQSAARAGASIARVGTTIAVLVPLSSASAELQQEAQAIRSAAELAKEDFGDGSINLVFEDSGITADSARTAARAVISKGADVIVGPIFASGAEAASAEARGRQVPLISRSTDTSLGGD